MPMLHTRIGISGDIFDRDTDAQYGPPCASENKPKQEYGYQIYDYDEIVHLSTNKLSGGLFIYIRKPIT